MSILHVMTDTTVIAGVRVFRAGDYFALLKPRVMSLVVFTAAIGMFSAPGEMGPLQAFSVILLIAIGGGASGALNMWWDADIDALMRRTANRPVPAGRISRAEARNFGLVLSVVSVVLLGFVANFAAAAMLAFTIFFYVVIYTMWLKRSTPWNIVIGGASGAFPPIIGWLAVTGDFALAPVLMFGLVLMWTPPHFWSLALFMNDDYSRARVPMLTVTHGCPATRRQILIYTIMLAPIAILLGFTSVGGPVYFTIASAMTIAFIYGAYRLWRRDEGKAKADCFKQEKRFFRLSLFYLFSLFSGLLVEAGLRWAGFA